MKLNSLFGGLIALIGLVLLAGCGGGGGSAPERYLGEAAEFVGGRVYLEKDRGGGGPSIQIESVTVRGPKMSFVSRVIFFYPPSTTNSTVGSMVGSFSSNGSFAATITLEGGGEISVWGEPLRWETNRGGPGRILSGSALVTYYPTEGGLVPFNHSTFELYQ